MTHAANTPIEPQIRSIDGLAIRIAESKRDPALKADALLLAPWPESIYAFEPTWARLAAHANLVAVDLPGFGRSEFRSSLMSPRAMGEFVVRIADTLGLECPHILGPDIGTAASLFAAALYPGRFRSLVVGAGGMAVPLQLGEPLKGWVETPDIGPYRNMDGREIVTAVISFLERYKVPKHVREDYLEANAGARFADSMGFVREYPRELPILRDLLPNIRTPVRLIAGSRDLAVPAVNAEFTAERLPDAEVVMIDSGHFSWEDAPEAYADNVISWWEKH